MSICAKYMKRSVDGQDSLALCDKVIHLETVISLPRDTKQKKMCQPASQPD